MSWRSGSPAATDPVRGLVRAILVEDLAKLKNWMLQSYNPEERELAKLDIIPIGRGRGAQSELGSGLFNVVREVIYKGKRRAARYSFKKEELESLLNFVSYRDKLDPKFRKHFPKVYTTFEFVTDGRTYYGAVVELLEPTPPGLVHDIDIMSLDQNLQRHRVELVKNPAVVKALMPKNASVDEKRELGSLFNKQIEPLLDQMVGMNLDDVDDKLTDLSDLRGSAVQRFVDNIFKALRGEVIPSGRHADETSAAIAPKHPSKAVRDFYKFIQALKAKGLQAEDLHPGNFMMRPGTNDFVVVDPGFFLNIL